MNRNVSFLIDEHENLGDARRWRAKRVRYNITKVRFFDIYLVDISKLSIRYSTLIGFQRETPSSRWLPIWYRILMLTAHIISLFSDAGGLTVPYTALPPR